MRKPSPKYIFFVFIFAWCGYAVSLPLMPEIYTYICKGDLRIHNGINCLAAFLASPTLGALSDRYGRKPLLIASLLSTTIMLTGLLNAQLLIASAYLLFLFSFASGLCAGIFPVSYAYVVDVSTPENRSANFGLIGAAIGISFIIGPALGSIVAAKWNIAGALLVGMLINISGLIFVASIVPESREIIKKHEQQNITWSQLNPFRSFAMLRERPLAMLLSVVLTLDFTAQYGVIDVYVLYFKYRFDWQIMNVGIALSYAGIIIALTQGIGLRWVVPRLGERRTSLICASLLVLFTFPMGLLSQGWMLFLLWPILLPGYATTPLLQSLVSKEYDARSQGELLGVLGGLKTLAGFIGPLISNNLFAFFISENAPVVIPGISFFACSLLYGIALSVLVFSYRYYPEKAILPNTTEDELLVQPELAESQ